MKRILLTALCLVMTLGQVLSQEIKDRAEYNLNRNRALWYNSGNAAGLAREDMMLWRDVTLGYNLESGSFTDSWGARTQTGFNLGGDMLMDIEGFTVAAKVSLDHTRLRKCQYNTSLYEVVWDMPFFLAMNSPEPFSSRHNEAGMEVSAAAPLMFDGQLSVGMALRAQGRSAVKRADPVGRYGSFDMEIAPGATYAIDEDNIVGLVLRYRLTPAKAALVSASETPVGNGLGNYRSRWIGEAVGKESLKYSSNRFGLDLQYNRIDADRQWLVEFSFDKGATRIKEQDALLGRVSKYVIGFDVQGLFGEDRDRKLNFALDFNGNRWLGSTDDFIGRGGIFNSHADYSIYTDAEHESYDIELGAGMDVTSISNIRKVSPEGRLSATSIMPSVFLGKNIQLTRESSLLARLDLGYNFATKARYEYAGNRESVIANMYESEAYYLSRFFFKAAADVEYSFRINSLIATYAKLNIGHLKPTGVSGVRFIASLSVGAMF